MGSDRARLSYDRSRHWRGVINQQGRVTLEADWNEAATIAAEENREQLIEIVGPAGTPDDGYAVVPVVDGNGNATGDLTITHGTMYVGGERVELDADLDYGLQGDGDWVDLAGDPLWVSPAVPDGDADESVYLLLREQEVGAVEDPALLDIALGGPDTSERLRIVQRVVRRSTGEDTCAGSLGVLEKDWAANGLSFDPATMRLESASTLQVLFQQDPEAATPCEPVAQGGYLGAENQLIRVQVASVDENGAPTLVWSFDNAYFLYRVEVRATDAAADTTVLFLPSPPVDQFHQPAAGQAVEVLPAAAKLSESPAEAGAYAAATTGIVTTVTSPYQPDTQEVVIGTALGAPTTESPVIFLRVWQETIPGYAGGPVALGDTGVQVTVDPGGGAYHVGDYWVFAVRPGTPMTVSPIYPQRYLDAPQPPEGPRLWTCPLAVVVWSKGTPTVIDCRNHFGGLVTVDENECCCVCVSVETVGGKGLQALINRYANRGPVTFCLQPGTYSLPKPLVITGKYRGLTIKGCGPGVVIEAEDPAAPDFMLGLILLDEPTRFALRGVELHLPNAQLKLTAAQRKAAVGALLRDRQSLATAYLSRLFLSLGIYVFGGDDVTIDDCTFVFASSGDAVFAAGVFAVGTVRELELDHNRFTAAEPDPTMFAHLARGLEADNRPQLRFGYLQVPSRALEPKPSFTRLAGLAQEGDTPAGGAREARMADRARAAAASSTGMVVPALVEATVSRNHFDGVTVPLYVFGSLGPIRIDDNVVRGSYGAFWLVDAKSASVVTLLDRLASVGESAQRFATGGMFSLGDPAIVLAMLLGRILPLTPDPADPAGQLGAIAAPRKALLADAEKLLRRLYTSSVTAAPAAAEPAEPAPAADATFPAELAGLFKAPSSAGAVAAAVALSGIEPRLQVSRNDVDRPSEADAQSGPALLVAMTDTKEDNSLVCNENRFCGRAPFVGVVELVNLLVCTVTGNLVANEGDDTGRSIDLTPVFRRDRAAVAVTGNVFAGRAILPPRPLPAPFNTWDSLNTEV